MQPKFFIQSQALIYFTSQLQPFPKTTRILPYKSLTMVRIKERYLLVNIVYPADPAKAANSNLPDSVLHHQPTVAKLTAGALTKGIKAEVASLYGDYGSGALMSMSGE
jgi:hypothetical protein